MTAKDLFNSKNTLQVDIGLAEQIGLHNSVVYTEIKKAKKENNIDLFNKQDLAFVQKRYLPFFSIKTIQRSLEFLLNKGYITADKIKPEEAKEIVLKNKHNCKFKCEWCGCGCNVINEHHYPIPKSMGGTKIVRISCRWYSQSESTKNCVEKRWLVSVNRKALDTKIEVH